MNVKTALKSLFILSLLGWINSFYTLWHRNKMLIQGLEEKSFCNVSNFINCDAVASSSYSAIGGFPTAALGMIFYSLVFVFALWLYFKESDREERTVAQGALLLFVGHVVALIPTLALAAISFTLLSSLCLMCLLTYVINLIMTYVSFKLYRSTKQRGGVDFGTSLKSLSSGLWIMLAVIVAVHAFIPTVVDNTLSGGNTIDKDTIKLYVNRHMGNPQQSFSLQGEPSKGPEDAAVTIVEFGDYQCPHCARSAITLPSLLLPYAGKVRHVFKNYPLSMECNPGVSGAGHTHACRAAKAGICVFEKSGNENFLKYKEELFSQQSKINVALIDNTAQKHGLSAEELKTCLDNPATHQKVLDQVAEGSAKGVQGTPAIFVNGRFVDTGPQPIILRAIIEEHLKR